MPQLYLLTYHEIYTIMKGLKCCFNGLVALSVALVGLPMSMAHPTAADGLKSKGTLVDYPPSNNTVAQEIIRLPE